MANFSDFAVYVDWQKFEAAKEGDLAARKEIAEELDGADIYFHMFARPEGYIGVTLADVICAGIIPRVTLHKDE